jgi:hypothetical protein
MVFTEWNFTPLEELKAAYKIKKPKAFALGFLH